MPVSINDGSLKWVASIDTDQLEKQVDDINKKLAGVAKESGATVDNFAKKAAQGVNKLANTVETLRAKILAREDFIIREVDLNKIAQYNREIESLKLQITQILSAGRSGFDNFGNAIKTQAGLLETLKRKAEIYKTGIQQATLTENVAKYNAKLQETNLQITKLSNAGKQGFDKLGNAVTGLSGKTNLLSKGFSLFRQAALFIPGIGLAGIFSLIGEGLAALVKNLFKSSGELKTFAQNFKNLKDVISVSNKEAGKQITDLKLLYAAATDVNLSMKDRLKAVKALKDEFPDYFKDVRDETILNGKAQKAYDDLTDSIIKAARARAAKAKLDEIASQKLDIAFQKQKIENAAENEKLRAKDRTFTSSTGGSFAQGSVTQERLETKEQAKAIIERRKQKALREEEKKEISLDQQEKFLINFAGQKAITKVVTDEQTKRDKVVSRSRENPLLEKKRALLQSIIDLERDSAQTGLPQQESQIDKINEKYDKQLLALQLLNKEIEKYNKNTKGQKIEQFGKVEVDRINKARVNEVANFNYKKDAEQYIQSIKDKQKAFDEFEKAVATGNTLIAEEARKAYEKELGGFDTYLDFLKSEYDKLIQSLDFDSSDNVGDVIRFDAIAKLISDKQKEADEKEKQTRLQKYTDMLRELQTFNQQRADINRKYNELEATLEKSKGSFSPEEFERRKKLLEQGRKEELTSLNNHIIRQSSLYKNLNEDIIAFSRDQIKERIKDLENQLKTDTSLTPQMRADIQSTIDQYKGLLDSTNKVAIDFEKLAGKLGEISGIFSDLGSGLEGLNDDLADVLNTLGEITGVASSAASAIAQFASGNIVGGIASTVKAVVGIFSIGKRARESRRAAEKELQAFQDQVLQGEIDVNQLYRQRSIEQAKINKLKLDGLKAEFDALKKNAAANLSDYQRIFALLQQESAVIGKRTEKTGGILGIGRKTKVVDELQGLTGLNFEQLESLFLEGKLTGRAKELFETLQKLKQEGLDIEQAMADAKQRADEIFTATTAESIADSIIDGFRNGERSSADFADNFQSLMQNAMLNSLKFKYLEGPLQDFFASFSESAESDGALTSAEIERLRAMYNSILTNANTQFEQLQSIAGLNFNSSLGGGNTLTGAIKGMTEQQAELLAGQFGGLRITALDQLLVARNGLTQLQKIEANTFKLHAMYDLWRRLETNGLKAI
jgi:hypothetical protein